VSLGAAGLAGAALAAVHGNDETRPKGALLEAMQASDEKSCKRLENQQQAIVAAAY